MQQKFSIMVFDEKRNIKYYPGDIIFVDSNYSSIENCFGVVVDKDFWSERVKKENVFTEHLKEIVKKNQLDYQVLFRVLGTRAFRQYWKANDREEFEPNERVVMHYRCQLPVYVDKVNLKPIIELSRIDSGRVGEVLISDSYALESLIEAEIVYAYLEGKRFDSSEKNIWNREKLLRLLKKAIPINS